MTDEFWVLGEVLAEILNALPLQVVDRGLHLGEILLPDGHSYRLKYMPIPPLGLAQCLLGPPALENFLCQLFVDRRQLAGPFHHTLLELLIHALDLGLGLLEPGGLDDLPALASLCDGKLVRTHHIQDLRGSARRERVRAQHGQALIGDRLVQGLFVFAEVLPVLLF